MKAQNKLNKEQQQTMAKAYRLFKNALNNHTCVLAKKWLEQHALNQSETQAGYISPRVHQNKPSEFKTEFEAVGLLKPHRKQTGHLLFGKNSIVFPLKDEENKIVNFCAIGIESKKTEFLNQQGLYPNFPPATTEKLFITKTILDAATILQCKTLKQDESVIALYNGAWMTAHTEAIEKLKRLKEVIVIE